MKIAITNATTWPWVRRGAERFINEFARFLAGRGHDVTIISTKPGAGETHVQNGYRTICHRRLWHPVMGKAGLLEFHMFFFTVLYSLLKERYDVVFSLTFMDAFAAILTQYITKAPCVFCVNGLPPKVQYFRSLTMKGAVFGAAVRRAGAVVAISEYVREYLRQRWGRGGDRLPIPVDLDSFGKPDKAAGGAPLIVCAAALDDRRKGGDALFAAFAELKLRVPGVKLLVAYDVPEEAQRELLDLVPAAFRDDIEFRPVAGALPEILARATITVLPSLWEAYGMLVIESFAAGTPVVATRQGALPEHFPLPELGCLFDPGPDAEETAAVTNTRGLAQAMEDCLQLAGQADTSEVCRRFAERYSWEALGPSYERLMADLLGAGGKGATAGISACGS